MATNRATAALVAGALASGGAAAYLMDNHIEGEINARRAELDKQFELVPVVVPKHNLRVGALLTSDNLAVRQSPGAFVHAEAVRPENVEAALGHRLTRPLNEGEPLLMFHVAEAKGGGFANLITKGKRALTFPVDVISSMSGLLRPGDRIDLLATLNDKKQELTKPLLSNVKILATGVSVDELNTTETRYQTITLLVDPIDAARITHARQVGNLTVVLRAPADEAPPYNKSITMSSLLGHKGRSPGRDVEIIRGGIN